MCFADKAQAIHSLKKVMEEERGEAVSWREFERMLPERGLTFSHAQLARMKDLIEILSGLVPAGLLRELGPHHVQTIKSAFSEWAASAGEKLKPFLQRHENVIREGFMSCGDNPSKIVSALQRIRADIPIRPEPGETGVPARSIADDAPSADGIKVGLRPEAPETVRLLQRIIMLRPRNYELAAALAGDRANVRPSDSGFGFDLDEGDAARLGDRGFLAAISTFRTGRDGSISLSAWCALSEEDAGRLMELLRNVRHIVRATLRTRDETGVSDPAALDNVLVMRTQERLDSGAGA